MKRENDTNLGKVILIANTSLHLYKPGPNKIASGLSPNNVNGIIGIGKVGEFGMI